MPPTPDFLDDEGKRDWSVEGRQPIVVEAQCRAYRIADNRAGEARRDDKLLKLELNDVGELAELTALDPKEMKRLGLAENAPKDALPASPTNPVARVGEVWQLGKHRLLCGDSTRPEYVSRLMGDERAILFATDPPYAVAYAGCSHPPTRANRDKDRSKVYHEARQNTFENAGDQLGRRCYAIELEPRLVKVAISKLETLTGQQAAVADLIEADQEEASALG